MKNVAICVLGILTFFVLFTMVAGRTAKAGSPTLNVGIKADKVRVSPGGSVKLTWWTDYTNSHGYYGHYSDCMTWSSFGVGANEFDGERTVNPLSTTKYEFGVTCYDSSFIGVIANVTVNVGTQTMDITERPEAYIIGSYENRTRATCPYQTVACGAVGGERIGQVYNLLCCNLSQEAKNLGIVFPDVFPNNHTVRDPSENKSELGYPYHIELNPENTWAIDMGTKQGGSSAYCPNNGVIVGGEWAKNYQIDFGVCRTLPGPVEVGVDASKFYRFSDANQKIYCDPDAIVYGGKNRDDKNDLWEGIYCAKTFYNAAPTATLTINGSSDTTVSSGDSVTYVWSSTNATDGKSTWDISPSSPDPCEPPNYNSSDWVIKGTSGSIPGITLSCMAGYTYITTYTVTGPRGTASARAELKVLSSAKTNQPPSISSVTTTEPDYCSSMGDYVSWTYFDPEGNPQSAYQVQIDNNSSFNSPEVDSGKVTSSSISYFASGLAFSTTYKARVRVWDSNDNVSGWTESGSWKTPKHAYPLIDFTWSPSTFIPAKQPVQFTDQTTFYDGTNNHIWLWLFGDSGSSTQQNPSHTYNQKDSYNVILTAIDKDNYSCSLTKKIDITLPLPTWKEVIPR